MPDPPSGIAPVPVPVIVTGTEGVQATVGVAVGVFVAVDVAVDMTVAVAVGVFVGVKVAVAVAVGVNVAVFVGVGVFVAVLVGVLVAVFVGVFVGVEVGVFVGVATAPVTVKFVFEMSKKMLPTASTFILAVEVVPTGIVTACDPSLGVVAAKTIGNVCPPSVDIDILTLAQLTGAAVVFATFHVTVCDEPPAHETFVLGDVTVKGPEVLLTVTIISSNCV